MKILVVEDDPVSLELLASIFEKQDFDVLKMNSATMALNLLRNKGSVDLIVTDAMMPTLSGFDFLKQLKADKRLQRIPVIMCTAMGDKESVLKGISLGAADYVTKPVDADILLAKVRKIQEGMPGVILIVDDETLFREYLGDVLKKFGFRSLLAASGKEALGLAESNRISLVISDIKMLKMDGHELLENMKAKYPRIPLMLMSGYVDNSATGKNSGVQADGFISKPFHNTEIISKIEKLIAASN